MILAAGKGTRMRPLTDKTPKPLLEAGGKPLIVWHIERLKSAGIEEIVVNIAHLGEQIPRQLGDGAEWGVRIVYSDECLEGGLETLGGIVKALPHLRESDPFLVVNGDIWCDYPYDSDFRMHQGYEAHLVLVPNPPHHPQGDFGLQNDKVTNENTFTFAGIGYYRPAFFEGIAYGKAPLAPLLREKVSNGLVSGECFFGEWYDIGTPERLDRLRTKLYDAT